MLGTALTKNLEVHFESVFLRKGAKQTGAQESFGDFHNRFIAYYAEISALLKYSFGKSKTKPYIKLGGFSIGLRFDAEYDFNSDNFTATFNANNLFDIRDLSYSLGSGIDFKFVKFSLFIEGRYSLGIVDVFKGGQGYFGDGGLVVFDDYEIKNNGLLIMT